MTKYVNVIHFRRQLEPRTRATGRAGRREG